MPQPLLQEPAAIFLTIMAVILVAPLLSERARLPGIVGLIVGGIIVGRHGLHLLVTGPTIELFGAVGLIYLMFNAGLELNLQQFNQVRDRSVVFAALSFILPQASGILLGQLFGLSLSASILLGAIYASQTLVAYPLLSDLGIIRNEAVAITVGATIFTDIASLLVLGVITGSQNGDFSLLLIVRLIVFTGLYAVLILLGVPRLGKFFFRRFSGTEVEFQFVLVVLFVAAVLAEAIGMHTIVGAFLAGLAVNTTLSRDSRVVEQVMFLGESFFVPLFLVTVGMRLDPLAVFTDGRTLLIGLALTAAVYVTKFVAAWIAARIYGYSRDQMLVAWGLSHAQAAATLAALLVGRQIGLFPDMVFNGAILMILVTSVTSPLVVERFGAHLQPPAEEEEKRTLYQNILVPVTSDEIPEYVIGFASLLARAEEGKLLVLNIAASDKELKSRREKLKGNVLKDPDTSVELVDRIEEDLSEAVLKEVVESEGSLVLLHWLPDKHDDDHIVGAQIDRILWDADMPVWLVRLLSSVNAIERVVFVVAAHTVGVKLDERALEAVNTITKALDVPLMVMATGHYVDTLDDRFADDEEQERNRVVPLSGEYVPTILEEIQAHDFVILPSMGSRSRTEADAERVPYALLQDLPEDVSLLLVHFP